MYRHIVMGRERESIGNATRALCDDHSFYHIFQTSLDKCVDSTTNKATIQFELNYLFHHIYNRIKLYIIWIVMI